MTTGRINQVDTVGGCRGEGTWRPASLAAGRASAFIRFATPPVREFGSIDFALLFGLSLFRGWRRNGGPTLQSGTKPPVATVLHV